MEREPNNQGRRAASRATKLRRRKSRMNFILLGGFIALLILLILITPKEPKYRATYSVATESGLVEGGENEISGAYDGLLISEIMSANNRGYMITSHPYDYEFEFKPSNGRSSFDQKTLKANMPDIWEKFKQPAKQGERKFKFFRTSKRSV